MTATIDITPTPAAVTAMREGFAREALAEAGRRMTPEQAKTLRRVLAPLNIVVQCTTNLEELSWLRDQMVLLIEAVPDEEGS